MFQRENHSGNWLSTFTASQRVKGSAHGRHFIMAPGLATESNEINSSFI